MDDVVVYSLVTGPGMLDDPEGLAEMIRSAKWGALGHGCSPSEVDDVAEWDEPIVGLTAVPRNEVDGGTPADETPVRMAQVSVRGRKRG